MSDRRSGSSTHRAGKEPEEGVALRLGRDHGEEIESLASSLGATGGGRTRLSEVLADLNRSAAVTRVPASAAHWGFRWDDEDMRSQRWWPHGVTSSADRDDTGVYDGRRVVLASWAAKEFAGLYQGARISVVDLERLRYRHVLLVETLPRGDGSVDVRPLEVPVGGIVWHGSFLHVAAATRGLRTFRLDDLMRVGDLGDQDHLAVAVGSLGYRYLLPARFSYDAIGEERGEPLGYSCLSLAHEESPACLVAGECGRARGTPRLMELPIDPATSLPAVSDDGTARPLCVVEGVEDLRGAAVVDGQWYLASGGRYFRGSLYVGQPGALRRNARVLPAGVRDLASWPSQDELWSLSQNPGRRFVFAMKRARFD